MNVRSVVHWFLVAGFASAPFASIAARRFWPRVSGVILLIASLSAVGCVAYVIDRNSVPPFSWLYWGTVVLLGIGISIYAFVCNKFRFALFLGIVFLCANVALHFFATDFAMDCKRAGLAVQRGMTIEQVRLVVPQQLIHCPDYHLAMDAAFKVPNDFGYVEFDLRPEYINLPRWTMHVNFVNGRVRDVRAPLGECRLLWWEIVACIALCAVCCWSFGRRSERPDLARAVDLTPAMRRIHEIRARGYPARSHTPYLPARKALMHFAAEKIRWFAYFARLRRDTDGD